MRRNLEARPVPTGVAMRRAFNATPRYLICGGGGEYIHREGDLEQDMAFVPEHVRVKIDAGAIVEQGYSLGDDAVLMGSQGDKKITVEELAEKAGTISYEILCGISPRVPRVYTKEGKIL